jgi:hypothetical protein
MIIGENQEQLGMNFTGINQLSCRAKNTIGQTEEKIQINLLCKIEKYFSFKKFFFIRSTEINYDRKSSFNSRRKINFKMFD